MHQIAVLSTSAPAGLAPDALPRLTSACEAIGYGVENLTWLSEGAVVEFSFAPRTTDAPPDLLAHMREALAGDVADINIVPAENRRKSLLVADMDSTVITSESLDDLAALAGKGDEVAAITARAMRGELDFTGSLRERVRMLAGCPADLIQTIIDEAVISPGAAELVATMRRHGARAILASGGFAFLASVVAEQLGFDAHFANSMLVEDGHITGEVGDPVMDRNAKRDLLNTEMKSLGLTPANCATIGDGANDRGMTEAAGLGVAFRGKPALKEATPFWLDHTDLRGLLWLQGYDDGMIVAS